MNNKNHINFTHEFTISIIKDDDDSIDEIKKQATKIVNDFSSNLICNCAFYESYKGFKAKVRERFDFDYDFRDYQIKLIDCLSKTLNELYSLPNLSVKLFSLGEVRYENELKSMQININNPSDTIQINFF